MTRSLSPKIYHLHPLVAGPLSRWKDHFARIRSMGFNWVCLAPPFAVGDGGDIYLPIDWNALHPSLEWNGSADTGLQQAAEAAALHDLKLMLDIQVDRLARNTCMRSRHPAWFKDSRDLATRPDPRQPSHSLDAAYIQLEQAGIANEVAEAWTDRLSRFIASGVAGVRCLDLRAAPPAVWQKILTAVRAHHPDAMSLVWIPHHDRSDRQALGQIRFDRIGLPFHHAAADGGCTLSDVQSLRRLGPVLGSPEPSFAHRLLGDLAPEEDPVAACRSALQSAASIGNGLFVPMGFEFGTRVAFDHARASPADFERARSEGMADLTADIIEACAMSDQLASADLDGAIRLLPSPNGRSIAFARSNALDFRNATTAAVVTIGSEAGSRPHGRPATLPPQAGGPFGNPQPLNGATADARSMRQDGIDITLYQRMSDIRSLSADAAPDSGMATRRIAIEAVSPVIPDGDFPVKAVVGAEVIVSADIFSDGHDQLAAALRWRPVDRDEWDTVAMRPTGNDRWQAAFTPGRVGEFHFKVEAWWDVWGTFHHDLSLKNAAGQNVALEIQEGLLLIEETRTRTKLADLDDLIQTVRNSEPAQQVETLLAASTAALMHNVVHRPCLTTSQRPMRVRADRPQAEFASWYELFPRSITTDPHRHGTFRDVIGRLPAIRDMGFDVLYFPPIHPIGLANRKGRNNSLKAEPQDVGSPYAIGGADGGHEAVHPDLGTLDDFRALVAAARDCELEIALDFAIQCSPDHPWLREHPDWFRWRPDGTLRYAENPPKKYEDIVNPDFFAPASLPPLWLALRDVIRFWVSQGVRIFRVDNPHTKPLPFWEWLITEIQAADPNVIFLAEAFTRPKMMYRLGKIGFSQSYTYFTWRDTKRELIDYMSELTREPARDCYRPNFFVNTPDINPTFLQRSGRPGFLIRLVLAATLSGSWGMYSGFEICESEPLTGREEYLNSEKYEIRPRDFDAAGNIVQEITQLNEIRRAYPALQSHLNLTFYNAFNDNIILYGKRRPGEGDMVLVAVNLDPHNAQEAQIEIPVWEFGLPDHASMAVRDLMTDATFTWYGKLQYLRLDPAFSPFAIWHITPSGLNA
jgi:starch synthase (maltosyl-transferring)